MMSVLKLLKLKSRGSFDQHSFTELQKVMKHEESDEIENAVPLPINKQPFFRSLFRQEMWNTNGVVFALQTRIRNKARQNRFR